MRKTILCFVLMISLFSCQKDDSDAEDNNTVDSTPPASDKTTWWKPVTGISFDWQLDDLQNGETFTSGVIDVDAFTTTAEQVAALHNEGKKVIAYLSVGTLENDRPDASLGLESVRKISRKFHQNMQQNLIGCSPKMHLTRVGKMI